jgi:hypothetical protein
MTEARNPIVFIVLLVMVDRIYQMSIGITGTL